MGWLRNLFANRKSQNRLLGMTERQFQEWMDLHRLYLVMGYYDGADVETLTEEAASRSVEELRDSVMGLARGQIQDIMVDDATCSVRIDASGIRGAGKGVWLDGRAQVGRVVALFPGLVYGPTQIRDIPGYPSFGSQSDFLMSRFDGYMVDSRAWMFQQDGNIEGYYAMRKRKTLSSEDDSLNTGVFSQQSLGNSLAVGHMVNHPPKDCAPNIMPVPVNWTTSGVDEHVPWAMVSPRSVQDQNVLKGLAFVAKRQIEDEELFVDYRLNPSVIGGVPEWYHPVDEAENVRRWS